MRKHNDRYCIEKFRKKKKLLLLNLISSKTVFLCDNTL